MRLRCHGVEGGASSPIALATLNARKGDEVWIGARGPQAADAVAALESLITDGFGESTGIPEATVATPAGPQGVSPSRNVGIARLMSAPLVNPPAEARPQPSQLPGEKTRLALARLVVSSAYVLRLDEPTNNCDPASREEILRALGTFAGAVVLVTHDEGAVEALGPDRVLLLPDGDEDLWSEDYLELVTLT